MLNEREVSPSNARLERWKRNFSGMKSVDREIGGGVRESGGGGGTFEEKWGKWNLGKETRKERLCSNRKRVLRRS